MKTILFVILLFLSTITPTIAELNYWWDDNGMIHYADQSTTIPSNKKINIDVKESCPEYSEEETKELIKATWFNMTGELMAGNKEKALEYFSVIYSRYEYRKILADFDKSKSISIFGKVKNFKIYRLEETTAECGAIREEMGKTYSYPARFIKDPDCVWRISGF